MSEAQTYPNAMTAAEVTERLGLQKETDTPNMNSVETDLTTRIDAAVSQVQQTAQQFQTTFEAEQSLESETDQHRGEQDGQRCCRQQAGKVRRDFERDEDHVDQDLLEEGFQSARRTALLVERGVSILTFQ